MIKEASNKTMSKLDLKNEFDDDESFFLFLTIIIRDMMNMIMLLRMMILLICAVMKTMIIWNGPILSLNNYLKQVVLNY